jgi:WD40 repeat protein
MEAWELTRHRKLWCVEAEHVGFAFALFREQLVTSYGESQIAYLSIANGTVVRRHARPSGAVFAICVDPVNRLVILACKDGRVAVLDMETGGTEAVIDAYGDAINGVAVTKSGSLCVTASQDGLLRVWTLPALQNIATMEESNEYSDRIKDRSNIRSVDVSPNGQHAISAGWDVIGKYDISVWDMNSYTCVRRVPAHKQFIEAVRYVDDQRALSASWDGTVRLHDLLSGKELHVFHGHSDWVLDISPVEQGRFLTTSKDGFVCLWSLHGV